MSHKITRFENYREDLAGFTNTPLKKSCGKIEGNQLSIAFFTRCLTLDVYVRTSVSFNGESCDKSMNSNTTNSEFPKRQWPVSCGQTIEKKLGRII